jgi:hypothetical protein
MSVGCDSKEVSKGGREERGKLRFGEEFEEGGFMVVKGRVEGCHELHLGVQREDDNEVAGWGM